MIFKKNKVNPYQSLFDEAMNDITNMLKGLNDDKNIIRLETAAMLYVLTDYAIFNAKKDRQQASRLFKHILTSYFKDDSFFEKELDMRINIYGQLIRGEPAKGAWFMGDKSKMRGDIFYQLLLAFGDFVLLDYSPEDYLNSPLKIANIMSVMAALPIMMEGVLPRMGVYADNVYKL